MGHLLLLVGWPRNGAFTIDIILQVKALVFQPGPNGHLDQVPYIIVWEDLAKNPPPWIKCFIPSQGGPGRDPHSLPAPLPQFPSPSLGLLPSPLCPTPNAPLGGPYLSLRSLSSDPRLYGGRGATPRFTPARRSPPLSARARGRVGRVWTSQAFPLRSAGGQMQYWPFSASDLYNGKTHNPTFSQDPQALTGLIESILLTHQPTRDDRQQLPQTLLRGRTGGRPGCLMRLRMFSPWFARPGTTTLLLVGSGSVSIARYS
ncbi:unnamed protein product [Nyctereutes procyonoides]|uniref:(raccoon dog) hypothetical protein n=1 Tax=Nyctereutes procyonoides TaxID=34880 RepID=A0A811Y5P9_NYCPR|nr:unnamed protein product [Nyctereutes procyonoides]